MTTRNIVPRANNEGGIGTNLKRWANGYFNRIVSYTGIFTTVNANKVYSATGMTTTFNTVADMQKDTTLQANNIVQTLGYTIAGDNGSAIYKITNSASANSISLNNGLYASMVINTFVTPEQFGAKGDGTTNDYVAIQTALDTCRNIVLTNGKTYKVEPALVVNQGQKINLNGATIKRAGGLFVNAKKTDTYTGFDGIGDIEIYNGVIEQGEITFIHAKNVYIHDVVFRNSGAEHWMEIAGCKNFKVDNCTFEGTVASSSARNYVECIQLDLCNPNAFPYFNDSNNPTYDNTMNEDIIVSNCSFSKGTKTLYTAIGSHAVLTDGSEFKNITIKGCVFNEGLNRSVRLVNINGCYVIDNIFKQNIPVNLSISNSCNNVLVQGNNFYTNNAYNIWSLYDIEDGEYYGTNWVIKDNVFRTTANVSIALPNVNGVKIKNNIVPNNNTQSYVAINNAENVYIVD